MKKILIIISLFLFYNSISYCQSTQNEFPVLNGAYFGQKYPGMIPEIFLPEVFNMYKYLHGRLVFSPDGKEVFWVISTADKNVSIDKRLLIKQKRDGMWAPPVESFFSLTKRENGPSYSIDGKRLYYQSRATSNENGEEKDIDIWFREREVDSWSEPQNIGTPVNSFADESQPWIASDGSIYFCRETKNTIKGQSGGTDIYYSKFSNGVYSEPIRLGPEINSEFHDTETTVAPDNSYILFISNRPGGYSERMNLYVSFKMKDGRWTKAKCLSHQLKIDNIWFPTLSYDGKYLFFCGGFPVPGGGYSNSHYYWVSTKFLEELRSKEIE